MEVPSEVVTLVEPSGVVVTVVVLAGGETPQKHLVLCLLGKVGSPSLRKLGICVIGAHGELRLARVGAAGCQWH